LEIIQGFKAFFLKKTAK